MTCRRTALILFFGVVFIGAAFLLYSAPPNDVTRTCDNENRVEFANLIELSSENVTRLQRVAQVSNTKNYVEGSVSLNFSPNSHLLAISGWYEAYSQLTGTTVDSPRLFLWDLPNSCFAVWGNLHHDPVFGGFTSTSEFMLVDYYASWTCVCRVLYAVPEGREIAHYTFDELPSPGSAITFISPQDGEWSVEGSTAGMFLISHKNSLQFYKSSTGELLSELHFDDTINISALSFSPDGKLIAIGLHRLRTAWVEIWAVPAL